jgi:hypothetical protein
MNSGQSTSVGSTGSMGRGALINKNNSSSVTTTASAND